MGWRMEERAVRRGAAPHTVAPEGKLSASPTCLMMASFSLIRAEYSPSFSAPFFNASLSLVRAYTWVSRVPGRKTQMQTWGSKILAFLVNLSV